MTDAIDIGLVYIKNQSQQEAAEWVTDRFENDPFFTLYLPGDLRLITVMEEAKLTDDMLVDFAVAAQMVCTGEEARGWIQPIPGITIDITPPKLFGQESNKVAM